MKSLGIFFLIVAAVCTIGGFANKGEPAREKSERTIIASHDAEHWKYTQQFMNEGADFSYAQNLADQYVKPNTDAKRELQQLQNKRERRMAYFFVPAGALAVIGLICCAIGTKKLPSQSPPKS